MWALMLHVSALNDSEYDSYTDASNDLTADGNNVPASDEHYDKLSVGVREVRAWLRGRYSTLPLADVDAVCPFLVYRSHASYNRFRFSSFSILVRFKWMS